MKDIRRKLKATSFALLEYVICYIRYKHTFFCSNNEADPAFQVVMTTNLYSIFKDSRSRTQPDLPVTGAQCKSRGSFAHERCCYK